MSVDDQDFKEFSTEALELLDNAEKSLLALEQGADLKLHFDAVFRSFHNIKGAAGMMELLELQSHMHELETTLMGFKESASIPKEFVSLFLRGIDGGRRLLAGESLVATNLDRPVAETPVSVSEQASFVPDSSSQEFFSECEEIVERVAAHLQTLEGKRDPKESVDALYRDFHSLKGGAFLFSFNQLGAIAHLIESALEPVRERRLPPSKALIDGMFCSLRIIEIELQSLKLGQANQDLGGLIQALGQALAGGAAASAAKPRNEPTPQATIQEVSVAALVPPPLPIPVAALAAMTAPAPPAPPSTGAHPSRESDAENSSIRVSVALLDNLMTLMGEMVLVRNQVLQFSNNSDDLEFSNLSKRLNAVTSEIQDGMMKTRMQPIGNVLGKFTRVVRDLSQDLGKQITLTLSGAETELDKSLLEAIKDPMTHIVRNSCDHGIEEPAIRAQAGKSGTGTISIRSYHEGGQVVIEVADDGKGLNREVLLKKGIEKGLITESQAKSMVDREAFNLIFAPGFSTAQQVTNVSGRGVGMDVVRTNIEKIGGTVDLMSVAGRGTTILIKIPLTLAIVPALIVNSGNLIFAIPQVKLVELVRVDQSSTENKIEYLQGSPVFRLRGNLLPLIDLNSILGLKKAEARSDSPFINIAVLNAESRSFGLIVEEVQDTADIVVKPLNRLLKSLLVYSGATILGDGSVALILDVLGLSKHAQIGREEQATETRQIASAAQARKAVADSQDYILVKVNSPTKHALILGYVHRLEEFKRSEIEYSGNRKVIRYRNSLLHIVTANSYLGYTKDEPAPRDVIPIIVVERAGALFGIEVDEILDTLSSDAEPDSGLLRQPGIFGNLNTAQELIVVIDPFELITCAFGGGGGEEKGLALAIAKPSRSLRVLLAEDTVFFRKAITQVLSKAGHEVTLASDGQEAFEVYSEDPSRFDIIVSDIEMPRMDGFTFAKAVRAGKDNPGIPMLAISSKADASFVAKGAEAGFNLYMEKLKPDFLLKAVLELTASRRKVA